MPEFNEPPGLVPYAQFGPLDRLHAVLRRRYPTVAASVVRSGALPQDGQPDAWLVVTHRDEGPDRIAWDRKSNAYVWIDNSNCLGPSLGTPHRLDQAADAVAREMRAPAAPTEPEHPQILIEHTTLTPLSPADVLRNREIIANRLDWPDGALQTCLELEARWPGWNVSYSTGVLGGPPEYLAFLDQDTIWQGYNPKISAADPAGLEQQIRDADARRPPRPR
ncbi:hypothetical protein [Actinomadura rugatobispora]|uniref:Uncharacterized protein n=1 Tax=Actinomadura rugatobispora TaxID=1994 RepID=A0ABW1A7H7_9ACTN|nr:hypothetical protein GCM10010200_038730 [Actinomadura rugatobispora]